MVKEGVHQEMSLEFGGHYVATEKWEVLRQEKWKPPEKPKNG